MKRIQAGILILLVFLLLFPQAVFAVNSTSAATSATLTKTHVEVEKDSRAMILRKYLEKYNSPLAPHAETFVQEADKNNIDWRLVASISGVESTFAHHLPYNSYNAWGWGIYGDNMIRFNSYDEAITTISKALRENYMDKWGAEGVYEIGRFYAASPTWAQRVEFFMNQIDTFSAQNQIDALSISI